MPASLLAHPSPANNNAGVPLLVDTDWLMAHRDAPGLVIIDARSNEDYMQGHIPGAISLPVADTFHARLERRVIGQAGLQAVMGARGINHKNRVIIYDNAVYMDAARILWALELYGHNNVSLMNGGYPAWTGAGLSTDRLVPVTVPVDYFAVIRPGRMATRLQMLLAIDDPGVVIVDTRVEDEYRGITSRARRSGHIPTAINLPSGMNLEVRQGLVFIKPVRELERLYKELDDYNKIILYCNGSRESSVTYLVLRMLGKDVSVYDGGWVEWGDDMVLPVVAPVQ